MKLSSKITPCLWFDREAEEAARFYTGIFPNSGITLITHYGKAAAAMHGIPPSTVLTVLFELAGESFTALNGGPMFKFNEAVSLQIHCETQKEIDYYWTKLSRGGDEKAKQCGWLKDRYGLSWQVAPAIMPKLIADGDPARRDRVMVAMMKMKKLDLAKLEKAHRGSATKRATKAARKKK